MAKKDTPTFEPNHAFGPAVCVAVDKNGTLWRIDPQEGTARQVKIIVRE